MRYLIKAGEAIAIRRGAQPIMRFATNKKKKKEITVNHDEINKMNWY